MELLEKNEHPARRHPADATGISKLTGLCNIG